MGTQGQAIAAAGQFSIYFAEDMLKGVTPATFARKPVVNGQLIDCNHPAWVYGHLGLYSSRMCEMIGVDAGPSAKPAGWEDLFKNGTPSTDDVAGTIFPPMEAVVAKYMDGYKHALKFIAEASDATLAKPNPATGRFAEMLPTVGAAVTFLSGGHAMSHLGQISTWRRCMGLGPAR